MVSIRVPEGQDSDQDQPHGRDTGAVTQGPVFRRALCLAVHSAATILKFKMSFEQGISHYFALGPVNCILILTYLSSPDMMLTCPG